MAKQANLEATGEVIQELGNSLFKVQLDNFTSSEVICTISGKIRQHYIKIMTGDKVKIEMSPYDLTKGRIVTRLNNQPQKESVSKNSNNQKKKK